MSWWNSSNFSDLASKALKNAQQKIDKALDIQDGAAGQSSSGDAAASGEKKPDFWNTWMGGETQSTEDEGNDSRSAWSLPWGVGSDKEKETKDEPEPVREKTAEEIKSEVLKAAKERAKAKSKLFPKKKLIDEDKTVATEAATQSAVKDITVNSELSLDQKILTDKTDKPKEEKIVPEKVKEIEDVGQGQKEIISDRKVAELEVDSPSEQTITKTEHLDYSGQCNEETHNISEGDLHGSCFQEITEYEAEIEEELGLESNRRESKFDKLLEGPQIIQNIRDEECHKEESVKYESVSEKDKCAQSQLNSPEAEPKHMAPTENVFEKLDENDKMENKYDSDPTHGDISSSVEFVTDKDLSTEESETVINTEFETGDQSSSDPELLDCERTDFSDGADVEIPAQTTSNAEDTNELLLKTHESEGKESNFDPSETSEKIPDSNKLLHETESQIDRDPSVSMTESLLQLEDSTEGGDIERTSSNSDVESVMNKLDVSMDTCTSEETIVDQTSLQDDSDTRSSPSVHNLECAIGSDEKADSDVPSQPQGSAEDKSEGTLTELNVDVEEHKQEVEHSEKSEENSELSPANSFVKCMLEDAIDDGKHDDNSDSHSTEKSDGSRSVYSNQESSDEIDTTTSSDIEIISLPTPNGENRQVSPLDPTPLRIALQKTNWRVSPTHRRTDSSDSSNTSKDGAMGELSPGRDHMEYTEYSKTQHEQTEGQRHQPELPALDEEDDNPYHPQRLLKDATVGAESHDVTVSHDLLSHDDGSGLAKKLGEMAEVLQAREEKLLQLSKDNCDLMETNSILRNQLKQSEEAHEAEMADLNELTAEFTNRLTDAEKRVTTAIREKEAHKNQVQELTAELAKRAGDMSLKQLLAEKDEQIEGLLQEGEKLSKSQLQSNTIIKKLRQKEKDNDSLITSQKKKVDTQTEELDHLHKVLESKEELEKKQTEAIAQLNAAVKKQEQEMVRLKSEHEDAVEKARGLQVALDNSYKEMADLHRSHAAYDSKAQELAHSAETNVREELKLTIEKLHQQNKWEKESLNMQIEDLRLSMARQEKEHNRREDLLRQEIADLQKQLQEDEARTQELTQGVSLATRPLLRQIENLQATYNAQSATWERVEKSMSDRLADTQNQLAVITEKERTANEQLLEFGSKVTSLETQNSRLKQEKSQMAAQLDMLKTKVEVTEDAKQNEAAQIEVMKQQMEKDVSDLKRQNILLETQLDMEKSKVEQEKKKVLLVQDQMRDMEIELARSRSRSTPVQNSPSPRSVSRQDSMVNSFHEQSFMAIPQDELDRSFVLSSPNGNKQSLYEALRQSGAANLLENLQSQLKLREGEITHLQSEIRNLERTRESMAKELVDLSNKNEDLEETAKELPVLTENYKELDQRYNALLQMYGEKVEESNELRLDLQDIKEMYKSQINQLLSKGD